MESSLDRMASTLSGLRPRIPSLAREWAAHTPFRYLVVDNFLPEHFAEAILAAYPTPDPAFWDDTTYIHQRRKFVLTSGFPQPIASFFDLTASAECRALFTEVTGIPGLLADPELLGGGLHQIANGGFLDVHVDFNQHPRTKLYRRLNFLLYMNKDWKPEYRGFLELWDMSRAKQLESIAPKFNRAVLFETNEISYHGHPSRLATPDRVTRKSMAIYYYTAERASADVSSEHNTLYRQTTGAAGYVKTLGSALQAAMERVRDTGALEVGRTVLSKGLRSLKGLPPENR